MIDTLEDEFMIRKAQPADLDGIYHLVRTYLYEEEWARVLTDGTHPTTSLNEWTVAEERSTGKIVSSMCMVVQTWTYGGIPFGVARMELVATDEPYRRKGLVRAQFRVLEAESTARGDWAQVVVGKPVVYRRLGYNIALLYSQGVEVSRHGIPALAEGEAEPFCVRPARADDIPFWTDLYQRSTAGSLVACQRDERQWQHDIFERKIQNPLQLRIVEDHRAGSSSTGQRVGGIVCSSAAWDGFIFAYAMALEPGIPWLDAAPGLLRYLEREGDACAARDGIRLDGIWIHTPNHPIMAVLSDTMQRVQPESPFAWYVRLQDPAGFLMHIAPVINQRIEQSVIANWSGLVQLDFLEPEHGDLYLTLQNGQLQKAETWHSGQPAAEARQKVTGKLPYELFLKILFGYRSVDEIEAESAEVMLDGRARAVFKALFPKQQSRILSVA